MASFNIRIVRLAEKEIRLLPTADRVRIVKKILSLATNPRPTGNEKLQSGATTPSYRLRQGNYRVVYTVDESVHEIVILRVGHRREVYR